MATSTNSLRSAWQDFACNTSKMQRIPFGPDTILVARPTVDAWRALERILAHHGYDIRIEDTDSYNCREIKGGGGKSLHSYGIALDINWKTNPFRDHNGRRGPRFSDGSTQAKRAEDVRLGKADTDMTRDMIAAATAIRTKAGKQVFGWGGDWQTLKDAMHFQIEVGPADLASGIDWSTVPPPAGTRIGDQLMGAPVTNCCRRCAASACMRDGTEWVADAVAAAVLITQKLSCSANCGRPRCQVSNYPLRYKLTWLPRFLAPRVGDGSVFRGRSETLLSSAEQTVRLVFIGDVSAVANIAAPIVDLRLKDIIASADLVVANCESPIVDRPTFPISTALGIRHAMTADFVDAFLAAADIDPKKLVVSLANNHVFDQGIEGFDATIATLGTRGIRMIGTKPLPVFSVKRVRIAMPAFTEWRNESKSMFAGRVVMGDEVRPDDWRHAGADIICVVPHWGWEFRADPPPEIRAMAAKFISAGARIVAGHHAHIVQPVERIGAAVIAFGLGDFLGTAWSWVRKPLRTGSMLVVDVSADEANRGQLVRYQSIIFARERRQGTEQLISVE